MGKKQWRLVLLLHILDTGCRDQPASFQYIYEYTFMIGYDFFPGQSGLKI